MVIVGIADRDAGNHDADYSLHAGWFQQ